MSRCRPVHLVALPLAICLIAVGNYRLRESRAVEQTRQEKAARSKAAKPKSPDKPSQAAALKAPANWPADHPLPQVASNCARCHLTAGRELTDAVKYFAHSVHDLSNMSCNDCHGGNTRDDVRAHEEEFDFIGTKISAHLKRCGECHAEEAETLASGPHHWDFSQRINTKYPMCVDCHGNHDIGNPQTDFKLADVCADCHQNVQLRFPNLAKVVHADDRLWKTVLALRDQKLGQSTQRVPKDFEAEVAALRHETMLAMHQAKELSSEAASALTNKMEKVRENLDHWLKAQK